MAQIIAIIVAIGIAALGTACLLYPANIQNCILRTQSGNWAWKFNPFADWMKKPSYRWYLRFMGAFQLLFAATVFAAVFLGR